MRDPSLSPRSPRRRENPVPVTITLFNLLPPIKETEEEKFNTSAVAKRWLQFRSGYGSRLLVPVRLDIIVDGNDKESGGAEGRTGGGVAEAEATKDEQEESPCTQNRILYSSSSKHGAVHPSWDLLDERIELLDKVDTEMELYESMRAQIVVCETKKDEHDTSKDDKRGDYEEEDIIFLADFFLHPKKLRRLPDEHSDNFGYQPAKQNPPQMLPPNAVLVTYSDGSTRVSGSLYDLLLRNNVISEESTVGGASFPPSTNAPVDSSEVFSPQSSRKQIQHQETPTTQPRFDDNLFDTLDRANVTPQINRMSPTSLLFDETPDVSEILEVKNNVVDSNGLDIPELEHAATTKNLLDSAEGGEDNDDDEHVLKKHQHLLLPSELEVTISDLRHEAQQLEILVQLEEEALQEDLKVLQDSQSEIKSIMAQISKLKQERYGVLNETKKENHQEAELEFVLETQRIKLLQELHDIYPIHSFSENRYSIRGLELPLDIYDSVVSEEEISAALGFLCHLLVMVAKYLSIPFRYRIVCNSSRSAIQDDGRGVLPLFQARMVDREKLERGILLLERNVDCLLLHRNVNSLPSDHILYKVKRLFDHTIDEDI